MKLEREEMDIMDYLSQNALLKKTATGIVALPSNKIKKFLDYVFEIMDDGQKEKWYSYTIHLIYPESRWLGIENWMEKRFEKNIDQTPRKMASMCMHYLGIKQTMKPKMIVLAQKVKRRVAIRQGRSKEQRTRGP